MLQRRVGHPGSGSAHEEQRGVDDVVRQPVPVLLQPCLICHARSCVPFLQQGQPEVLWHCCPGVEPEEGDEAEPWRYVTYSTLICQPIDEAFKPEAAQRRCIWLHAQACT